MAPGAGVSRSPVALVLNAAAGDRRGSSEIGEQMRGLFAEQGSQLEVTLARGGEEITRAARRAVAAGCAALVAGGGDGTVNACAAELVGREIPLGVLPLGTLNHFAKDLDIPLEPEAAARTVLAGLTRQVDVAEVNGRIFLNNSSLGVYPRLVRLRERYQATGVGKWLAALWATLAVLRQHPFLAVRITTPEQALVRRTPFVFVGNNEYRMSGLRAGERVSLSGGRLAVYVMDAERRRGLLRLAWRVFRHGVDQVRELELIEVTEAEVETRRDRVQVALDGEVTTLRAPLRYRIRPGALRVLAPSANADR
jgi:diacylglycerol kinase family enzyme